MNPSIHRPVLAVATAVAAAVALSLSATSCSREEPEAPKVEAPVKAEKVERRTATPVVIGAPPVNLEPPVTSGPAEVLVKEQLPTAGPVGNEQEAWTAGEAAFKHYASMNGFSDEATKSFFLKHIAAHTDHFRLMMFGVLPGGPRYIAVKVYRDGRTEILPDEM